MFITLYFAQQANVCVSIIRVGGSKEGKRERTIDEEERKIKHISQLKIAAYMVQFFFAVLFCFNVHHNNMF